jgi:hypothetical protein
MDSRDEIALRCFNAMLVSMEAALQYISRRELLAFTSNVEAGNISPQTSDSLPNIPFVYSIRRMGSVSCTGDGAQQFVVRRAMETDIDRLMEVQFSAFRNDPYHEALFPGPHDSPLVRKLAGQRTLEEWRSTPTQEIMVCVHPRTEEILGFASWNFYLRERLREEWAKLPSITWAEGKEKKQAEAFLGATARMRMKIWEGRPHVRKY